MTSKLVLTILLSSVLVMSVVAMSLQAADAAKGTGSYNQKTRHKNVCGDRLCTGPAAATTQPSLGTSSNFAVLGSSTVTNTGMTTITGNLGVSPGTAITGFPPGTVTGTTYAGGSVAARAHTDAATAYGALSSAKCTTNFPAVADIGGKTLKPGVYCFPSSAAITGTLTLSGSGVYIFKIGSTLVTAAGPGASKVVLTNGASASNVFWAVGSSATLGTDSVLKGTIIAYSSITSTTGAAVDGRLIALNGAVTLDTNKITVGIYKK